MESVIPVTFKLEYNGIVIDDEITKNNLSINNVDYYCYYLDPYIRGNKGANSYVYALYPSQDFTTIEECSPQKVIKVSRISDKVINNEIKHSQSNVRFYREVTALESCKTHHLKNIIEIDFVGHIEISGERTNKVGKLVKNTKYFPFYMMDYAKSDLKQFLEVNQDTDLYDRLEICLQLTDGLCALNNLGYYHRDIKPDNILLFPNNQWKIGDLGLVAYRNEDWDRKNELIGPKGWLSPEAMNKYLSKEDGNMFDCQIDNQSDIFQLGKVFWYVIQGNAPIGCIARSDFKEQNEELYVLIRTMLNHSKRKRIKTMEDVAVELKRIIGKL